MNEMMKNVLDEQGFVICGNHVHKRGFFGTFTDFDSCVLMDGVLNLLGKKTKQIHIKYDMDMVSVIGATSFLMEFNPDERIDFEDIDEELLQSLGLTSIRSSVLDGDALVIHGDTMGQWKGVDVDRIKSDMRYVRGKVDENKALTSFCASVCDRLKTNYGITEDGVGATVEGKCLSLTVSFGDNRYLVKGKVSLLGSQQDVKTVSIRSVEELVEPLLEAVNMIWVEKRPEVYEIDFLRSLGVKIVEECPFGKKAILNVWSERPLNYGSSRMMTLDEWCGKVK